jgi:beta-lactamase superfamily II metal-dependent hydrolase
MFGFPRQEVVDRYASAGCARHRTDEGAIRFISDGRSITTEPFAAQ